MEQSLYILPVKCIELKLKCIVQPLRNKEKLSLVLLVRYIRLATYSLHLVYFGFHYCVFILKNNIAMYKIILTVFFSFNTLNTASYWLLTSIAFNVNLATKILVVTLNFMKHFSLASFKIFSLFLNRLTMMCLGLCLLGGGSVAPLDSVNKQFSSNMDNLSALFLLDNLPALFLQMLFLTLYLLSSFWDSYYMVCFMFSHSSLRLCSFSSIFFCLQNG